MLYEAPQHSHKVLSTADVPWDGVTEDVRWDGLRTDGQGSANSFRQGELRTYKTTRTKERETTKEKSGNVIFECLRPICSSSRGISGLQRCF